MKIRRGALTIDFDPSTLRLRMFNGKTVWEWAESYRPALITDEGALPFSDALEITHRPWKSGVGEGVLSRYCGFAVSDREVPYTFETLFWIEEAEGVLHCEWIPIEEEGLSVKQVNWPGPMSFDEGRSDWYTLLNEEQGLLVPNNWPEKLDGVIFNGLFGTAGAYMPWFAQVKGKNACLTICTTPWNAGYSVEHPAGGPRTHVALRLENSLGRMDYRRTIEYHFLRGGYNEVCKYYRSYAMRQGKFRSLVEKAVRLPSIRRLAGSAFLHKGIKTYVRPNSDFYDQDFPERNNSLTPFDKRAEEIREWAKRGVKKLYLHLDGWAEPGYDNCHPDYLPACGAAGGYPSLRRLTETIREHGYLLGLHDQYRDYYKSAPSYDEEFACRLPNGAAPCHQRWAGGPQSYLCTTQAPYYVKRNFKELETQGIKPDCAYLDVFTCNEGDECANPRHRMNRRESYAYRNACFDWLSASGILPSSEEVNEWAIPSQVFCHYAPYSFMLEKPDAPRRGIPVPLFNLVYHDCVIEPWMMDRIGGIDFMLYALLNGGAPYLERDGAYPGTDGSFSGGTLFTKEEEVRRSEVVCELHERVAFEEMVSHAFLCGYNRQRTVFGDGTSVEVDLAAGTYQITYPREEKEHDAD